MIKLKTADEIKLMQEGGRLLGHVKERLRHEIQAGVTPKALDQLAEEWILESGGKPSFKMVKNYHWTTCINVNEGVVHGIPTDQPFSEGDIVSLDVGMFYKGFHTDTSFTEPVGKVPREVKVFLEVGFEALRKSIKQAKAGNYVSDISRAMQQVLEKHQFSPVKALTGHGVGRELHEEPQVPCFWKDSFGRGELLKKGMVLAIETIYTQGSPDLVISGEDDWTISTKDGKIAGLFEETVAVGSEGPLILTV